MKHMIKKQYFDIEDEDIKRPMGMMEFHKNFETDLYQKPLTEACTTNL